MDIVKAALSPIFFTPFGWRQVIRLLEKRAEGARAFEAADFTDIF
jgi:hypothetical protein